MLFPPYLASIAVAVLRFQLKKYCHRTAISLSNTIASSCHGKILFSVRFSLLFTLLGPQLALPQLSRILRLPQAPVSDFATLERPDFSVRIPRPNAPPEGEYILSSVTQQTEQGVTRLKGNAVVEMHAATLKADEIEYDENSKIFSARGHVTYRNYDENELLYCDHAEYNVETEKGMFYLPRGFARTKIVARPGLLTSQEPFYFEGAFVEKNGPKYTLHDGFITDCTLPNPWWTLHSSQVDIVSDDHATARHAVYRLRNVPIFYFPVFYRSLKKEPRRSGFLTPGFGHSSTRGFMFGAGYFWAINRSSDLTYQVQDFTTRGFAHHVDFRGKPTQRSDFNLIFYGVQDRGRLSGTSLIKSPGYSITGKFRTEIGKGWRVRGSIDYLSSLAFRQQFTDSFNEAIFSETHSTGWLERRFSYYTFTAAVSRSENFQDAVKGNSVLIRKLPEVEFQGRDRRIAAGPVPLYVSLDTSFGLYYRQQPRPLEQKTGGFYETSQFSARANFQPSVFTAFHWGSLHLIPSLTLHETFYSQSLVNGAVSAGNLTRSAPEFNTDLIFPALQRTWNRPGGGKLKHVIEPRAAFHYVSRIQRFADALRFDTLDLLADTNEAQVGITNRFYSKKGSEVREILTWEIYQKAFFDRGFGGAVIPGQRNVNLAAIDLTGFSFLDGPRRYSPIVSTIRAHPRNGVDLSWQYDYDSRRHRVVNSTFQASFRVHKYFASAASDQIHPSPLIAPPANQFRSTVGYGDPNRKGWSTAFSEVYDYRIHQLEFGVAQVAYNTDCCGFSMQVRRLAFGGRNDNYYLFAFTVANMGSIGNLKKQERLF